MTVEFKFEIGDKVTSEHLGFTGMVEHACIGRQGKEYSVLAYSNEKGLFSHWLSEDLLKKV